MGRYDAVRVASIDDMPAELRNQHIADCGVAVAYGLYEGRNAWWSSWSATYSAPELHINLVKQRAEKRRVQGSVFTIAELPAVAFYSESHTLTAVRADGGAGLLQGLVIKALPHSLGQLAALVASCEVEAQYLFLHPGVERYARAEGLRKWTSKSVGTGSFLQWTESGHTRVGFAEAESISTQFRSMLANG